MALENCTEIIVKMQDAHEHFIDVNAALYFAQTFKPHFKALEKPIHNNWRLHQAYHETQGQMCISTKNSAEAKEIVTVMLNTIKGKTCTLPVKRRICKKLALMISTRQNYAVRQ